MQYTPLESTVAKLITPSLEVLGYEVVRIKYMDGERNKILQIMLDRQDGEILHVDDCAKASRQISAVMDVEDPISEKYTLEVSSPGLDRPLTRKKDFDKYKGFVIKLETIEKVEERRRFTGRLVGLDGDDIIITAEIVDPGAEDVDAYAIAFDNIKSSKLIMNDELLGISNNSKKEKNLKKEGTK